MTASNEVHQAAQEVVAAPAASLSTQSQLASTSGLPPVHMRISASTEDLGPRMPVLPAEVKAGFGHRDARRAC